MKKLIQINLLLFSITALLVSCRNTDDGSGDNSTTPAPTPSTGAKVSYASSIKPLIESSCLRCHGPGGTASQRPFNNYDQVKAAFAKIKSVTDDNSMPLGSPWTTTQKALFLQWQTDGFQQ